MLYMQRLAPQPDREGEWSWSLAYRMGGAYFVGMVGDENATWLYYPSRRILYGYRRTGDLPFASYQPLGSCGWSGFRSPADPRADPFESALVGQVWGGSSCLYSRSEIYAVDCRAKTVKRLLSLPKGEYIAAVAGVPPRVWQPSVNDRVMMNVGDYGRPPVPEERDRDVYVLTNRKRLIFLRGDKGVLAEVSLAGVSFQMGPLEVGCVPEKQLYFVQTQDEVVKFSENGGLLARFPRPDAPPPLPASPVYCFWDNPDPGHPWEMAHYYWNLLVLPVAYPPACCFAVSALTNIHYYRELAPLYGGMERYFRFQTWRDVGPCLAGALLALLFCNRRLREYPFSRGERVVWRLLVLVVGPGALLALYALYDWPVKEPCPACGKKRVVNRENCEFCGAPFPAPTPVGKEIFETAG